MDKTRSVLTTPSPRRDEPPEPLPTARQLIPGAYEPRTPTHRQPGSMGGAAFGSDVIPARPSSMDSETTRQRRKEGGGPGRVP